MCAYYFEYMMHPPNTESNIGCDVSCGPSLLWVIHVGFVMCVVPPIYTQHRTFLDPVGTSHLGQ